MTSDTLIGSHFHSFEEENGVRYVRWQGRVLNSPAPGWYFVRLYDWVVGQDSISKLIRLEEMRDWDFYESDEEMAYHYKEFYLHRAEERARKAS